MNHWPDKIKYLHARMEIIHTALKEIKHLLCMNFLMCQ